MAKKKEFSCTSGSVRELVSARAAFVRFWPKMATVLPDHSPKTRPVIGGFEVDMLRQVAGEGKQARPLPELEDTVQVELLAHLL